MTTTATSIVQRATDILLDATSVRWPARELVYWLNDGQREIAMYRPDSTSRTTTVTLVAGSRQSLDDAALNPPAVKLMGINRNMAAGSNRRTVRLVARNLLDSQLPSWHTLAGSINTAHYMWDAREPKVFYVYPPALATTQLEVLYSALPVDVPVPGPGALFSAVTGNLSVLDIHANALLDYILYRAFSKDSEFAGNEGRAQVHYAAFTNALGIEIKTTLAAEPQLKPGGPGATPV